MLRAPCYFSIHYLKHSCHVFCIIPALSINKNAEKCMELYFRQQLKAVQLLNKAQLLVQNATNATCSLLL